MGAQAPSADALVVVVEDDEPFREALTRLFRSVGLNALLFGSADEMLQAKLPDVPTCLVLDVRLPGLSGLDIQGELSNSGPGIPVVFMTGHGDIPMTVQAMKAGAVDFLTKPFRDQDILDAVNRGLRLDRERRQAAARSSGLRERYRSLTPRERDVMGFVAEGLLNKEIAARLELSVVTVKVHRAQVMRKMGARSVADLVRLADSLTADV